MHKCELRPMILAAASCHRAETIDKLLAKISRHRDNLNGNEGRRNSRVSTESGEMRFFTIKRLQPNCAVEHHIQVREVSMPATNVQFTVAAHIMAALGFFYGKEMSSATLAESVNADPTFVRKSLSKLSKAGLIVTTRGKNGASTLTRSPKLITLLDIYSASAAPPTLAIHSSPVEKRWPTSANDKRCTSSVLKKAQTGFEKSLDGITLAEVVAEIRRASR